MTRKVMTPDSLMHKCLLYDDNGMAYITALDAYTTLYTRYQELREAANWVDHLNHGCSKDGSTKVTNNEWFDALETLHKALRGE